MPPVAPEQVSTQPESSKAYVVLLKGVKSPHGTLPWADNVLHSMIGMKNHGPTPFGTKFQTYIQLNINSKWAFAKIAKV